MARIKLSSRVNLPASVIEAQKKYRGTVKGYSRADAKEIYDKLIAKDSSPEGVEKAKIAYKTARRGLFGNAYRGKLAERIKSMREDFKIHKAIGVLFTFLGARFISDYLQSRRSLRSKLDLIGHTLSIEMARDPKLRKIIGGISKKYPYLSVNKKGEIFLSSYSGSIFDKTTLLGKIITSEDVTLPKKEINDSKKIFGQKLNLKTLVSMGNPKFEVAKVGSRVAGGAKALTTENVTAALMGNNQIRIFSKTIVGGVTKSKERIITSEQVVGKKLLNGPKVTLPNIQTKIILLRVKEDGKPVESIRLELEAEKAEGIFKGFNVKEKKPKNKI